MSSFPTKQQLFSEDAKKCPHVLFFGILNSDNMSNHFSTKSFGKFQDKLRPAGVMTFFFFGFHLILGGKLDIYGIGASRGGHGDMAPPLWPCNKVLKPNL